MANTIYNSITQFVEFMKNKYSEIDQALLYFEGESATKNKFDKLNIKPVFIYLLMKDKSYKMIQHKEIFDLFDGELVVSFNENNRRKVEDKEKLYHLSINFEPKDFNGNIFYHSLIRVVTNEKNIEKIKKQITKYEYKEIDLPDMIEI